MDIHLLEILNEELAAECEKFQQYLNDYNELPSKDGDFGPLMGVLTDRFISLQWKEYRKFCKRGDKGSARDIARWLLEAMETRRIFK